MVQGRIHSIESMGLVDGPGIRTVVFLQGCALRCQYCHNPDTWMMDSATCQQMTSEELVRRLCRFKPYYGSEGGVTFSGGEPLLQKDFLLDVLPACRRAGIHTCLDTAGYGVGGYEEILRQTDLVLLDLKHDTREGFQLVTGRQWDETMRFFECLQRSETPVWLRHVVVPGLTDQEEHFEGLRRMIAKIRNVQRIELLPYHTLGVHKYCALGIPYPLEGVPPMEPEKLAEWQERLNGELAERTKSKGTIHSTIKEM